MNHIDIKNIYMAFLGAGDYEEAVYYINDEKASMSRYVQAAEIEILRPNSFDKIVLYMTETAEEKHYKALLEEFFALGVPEERVKRILISEKLDPEFHWKWFESILQETGHEDHLYIDMTHGYRIVPIVISTAVHYLQQIRNIRLEAVYYGAYEKNRKESPVINCRDFYRINQWADGINRLVNDADVSKIIELSASPPDNLRESFEELADPTLQCSLQKLIESIKNVEVDQIPLKAAAAHNALNRLNKTVAREAARDLLSLVKEKYRALAASELDYRQEQKYFSCQMAVIDLYIRHGLYMQAVTAMREMMVSWIDVFVKAALEELFQEEWGDFNGKKKKKYRKESRIRFAEKFFGAFAIPENKWDFSNEKDPKGERSIAVLKIVHPCIKQKGIYDDLRKISKGLGELRNGFDHAWTRKGKAPENLKDEISCIRAKIALLFEKTNGMI